MSWTDDQGIEHAHGPYSGENAWQARQAGKEWDTLQKFWSEMILDRVVEIVAQRTSGRVKALLAEPLETGEDASTREARLLDAGHMEIRCLMRPSLTCTSPHFKTRYAPDYGSQATITVRMPMNMWRTWSNGAVDFCEEMCDHVRESLCNLPDRLYFPSGNHIAHFMCSCDKAGANPDGFFSMSMQYMLKTPTPTPAKSE